MNPILPPQYFIPDVEARHWSDGRMYLYGSYDINGDLDYCSDRYHVFSSNDLITWRDHGQSFHIADAHGEKARRLYAPDCVKAGGRYALFYCGDDGSEGVAFSDLPVGPFQQARPILGADGDGIDPAVLVNHDGQTYYYWGQGSLRGGRLDLESGALDPASVKRDLLREPVDGFHEGASIRKRQGIYYLVYTDSRSGKASRLSYAMSDQPLGPFEPKGVIIDNDGGDPANWNNHGSIAEFNGQWYIFYHRSSQNTKVNRRVCVEPIAFNADGSIDQVEMTTQGISGPLSTENKMEAWRACLLHGKIHSKSVVFGPSGQCEEWLTHAHDGDWAAYRYIRFHEVLTHFECEIASENGGGAIEARLDSPNGDLLATIEIHATGGWNDWCTFNEPLKLSPTGVHAIYIRINGKKGHLADIKSFRFRA